MFRETAVFLFLLKFAHVLTEDDCESIRNCQQCIYTPLCGWYIDYSSRNKSGCYHTDFLEQQEDDLEDGYSHPPKTSFLPTKTKKTSALSPQEVSLNIRPNEPFVFPITFTPRHESWGTRNVQMKYRLQRPQNVKISFSSNCNGVHSQIVETDICHNMKFGSTVQFLVKIEVIKCSKNQPEQIQKIEITPSPSSATLRLNLYAYCYCPCEYTNSARAYARQERAIPDCKKRGKFTCEVCYCREGYAGKNCEINTSNVME